VAPTSILYDAECGFCRWSLAQLLRLDRRNRLRPVSLQQPEADTLLAGMSRDERMASWHLVDHDGCVYSGGDALAPLLRFIPGGRPFAAALAALPAVGDVAYRTVAGRRSSLGRLIPAASAARAQQRIEAATNRPASDESPDRDDR
jgi:predicted DCC family thiol-disulfide oxidoreductase YuxK